MRHDLSAAVQAVQAAHAAATLAAHVPAVAGLPLLLAHARTGPDRPAEAVVAGCWAAARGPAVAFVEPDLLDAATAVAATGTRSATRRLLDRPGVALHDGTASGQPDRERALRALHRHADPHMPARRARLLALLADRGLTDVRATAVRDGVLAADLAAHARIDLDTVRAVLDPAARAVADAWTAARALPDRARLAAVCHLDLPAPAGTRAVPTGTGDRT